MPCLQGTFISWDPNRAPGSHNYTDRMFELKSVMTAYPGHDTDLNVRLYRSCMEGYAFFLL